MRFVDTNIALYAVSRIPAESAKQRIASGLLALDAGDFAVSVQVLGEFYFQVTRASRRGSLTHGEALDVIKDLRRYHVEPLTLEIVDIAFQYRERFGLNYWDCLILAAAKLSGCDVVYSEDMSASQDYDGLSVINPFEAESEPARA